MTTSRLTVALPHVAAILAVAVYVQAMSQTVHFQTGLQFVAPVAVILMVHLCWMALRRDLAPGFARRAVGRAWMSATLLVAGLFVGSMVAPMPASADSGGFLLAVFCFAIIAVVIFLIVAAIVALFRIGKWVFSNRQSDDDIFSDYGTLLLVFGALGVASLEGLSGAYSFDGRNTATATRFVDAPPEDVWQAMQTATSPAFALPGALQMFPQPVEVEVDEGTALGARRVVRMSGREGEGRLTLQVTGRTESEARFTVQSDTSPFADWVAYETLTYRVTPEGAGTRLEVTLDYDRQLAPAWFFDPAMKLASWGAMDVLARDVKDRAETEQ
ncbi:MAG: SRPBCC family protein [Pseudomonadota bacterium]